MFLICRAGSSDVDEKAVQQFKRQQFMNLVSVIPASFEVAPHYSFYAASLEVRPREAPRVKQHFPNVLREPVPVPDSEMVVLVPAEEQALEMKRRQKMIDLGCPLGHPVVVGILGLKRKRVITTKNSAGKSLVAARKPHVCPYLPQGQIAVTDQPNAEVVVLGHRRWRAEGSPNHIVI